ncbi:hypothetical protein D3C73_1273030 [compost metagenome]
MRHFGFIEACQEKADAGEQCTTDPDVRACTEAVSGGRNSERRRAQEPLLRPAYGQCRDGSGAAAQGEGLRRGIARVQPPHGHGQ